MVRSTAVAALIHGQSLNLRARYSDRRGLSLREEESSIDGSFASTLGGLGFPALALGRRWRVDLNRG